MGRQRVAEVMEVVTRVRVDEKKESESVGSRMVPPDLVLRYTQIILKPNLHLFKDKVHLER